MRSLSRVTLGALSAVALALGAAIALPSSGSDANANAFSPPGRFVQGTVISDGRLLTPAGRTTALGDFPEGIASSPDGRWAVVSNAGQGEGYKHQGNESLQLVAVATGRVTQTLTDHAKGADTFYNGGVTWSRDGRHVYAVGGGNDAVYDYAFDGARLRLAHSWLSTLAHGTPNVGAGTPIEGIPATAPEVGDVVGYPRGVSVTPDGKTVVVTNEQGGSVAAIETSTGSIRWQTPLRANQQLPGAYPNGVALSPDGSTAYVAAQGANAVYRLDVATGAITGITDVGDHPVAVAVTPSGRQAFVADANDDSLAVLDLSGTVPSLVSMLSTHLLPGEANGSFPSGVAYDSRRHVVYVTNAGDNSIAVFTGRAAGRDLKVSTIRLSGHLPTAYYPTAVATLPTGAVLATSAKGFGGVPVTSRDEYGGNDMVGTLSRIAPTGGRALAAATRRAQDDELFSYRAAESLRPSGSPIPTWEHRGQSPIKHVVLVVRENRTFDQEFGDLRRLGHPDARVQPSYLEFGLHDAKGRTITPNAHAIAKQFATSDNFFSDGDASIQGHDWTTQGVSSLYTEQSWTQYYSNRNHTYDPTAPIIYPRCGALFQQLAGAEKSFRNFGELVGVATSQSPTRKAAPRSSCTTPGGTYDAVSVSNTSPTYPDNLTLTSIKDTDRLTDFEQEYAPLVATDHVPSFSYVLMGNDHTDGTSAGSPTPQALVATNDQGVGGLVQYLSTTPQWKSTVVFIEEDDSQDGLDHVDGHRNILLVASPYAASNRLSHMHASQASVTSMIDRILGLPPISSAAQHAPIPYDMFNAKPNPAPYKMRVPTYPQNATNPSASRGTAAGVPVDTSAVDLAGPVLEAQLWEATHPGVGMPAPLIEELRLRGGIRPEALRAWARGEPCACNPLLPGLKVAPGYGDPDG